MKKLLILGGSGFFGKSFLDVFIAGGLKKWGVSELLLASRNPDILSSRIKYQEGVSLIKLDVTKDVNYPSADFVIHAAATTDARKYFASNSKEKENIQLGALNFAKAARRFYFNSKIVYVSSGAVYGAQASSICAVDENAETNSEILTLDPGKGNYTLGKRDSENLIIKLGLDFGINVSIARCFAFVGPHLPLDQHFAVGNFIGSVLNKRSIDIKATSLVYRSYMHADDLVHWLMSIAEKANPNAEIYNVGSDDAVELHQIASWLSRKYGLMCISPEINHNIIDRYIPSIEKARKLLNLNLRYSSLEAIQKTIRQLLNEGSKG